jgi:hypothetical protein
VHFLIDRRMVTARLLRCSRSAHARLKIRWPWLGSPQPSSSLPAP